MKMTEATLDNIVIERPEPTPEEPQHLCLDKGFDYDAVREAVEARQYIEHIRSRGEEADAKRDIPGYRARRWVVERTHSWLNRFRQIRLFFERQRHDPVC